MIAFPQDSRIFDFVFFSVFGSVYGPFLFKIDELIEPIRQVLDYL